MEPSSAIWARICKCLRIPRIQGIDSASICSLAGRYVNRSGIDSRAPYKVYIYGLWKPPLLDPPTPRWNAHDFAFSLHFLHCYSKYKSGGGGLGEGTRIKINNIQQFLCDFVSFFHSGRGEVFSLCDDSFSQKIYGFSQPFLPGEQLKGHFLNKLN